MTNRKDIEQLSAYLDGELSEQENKKLEEKLISSPELQKELEELKRIKNLTSSVERIPASPYFETRLMAELKDKKTSAGRLKKWSPAIGLAFVTLSIMILLKVNPDLIEEIWTEQKSNIAGFYKENLQPLLFTADLTNEDIFNFAFSNELPLDNSREQYLELGYDENGKEYFEIKNRKPDLEFDNYENFVKALKLDEEEKEKVDSIIGGYAELLGTQVLVNENNTVAINPKLWNYRKALAADLLIVAEDMNKNEFYKIVPAGFSRDDKIRVVNAVNELQTVHEDQYIFFTPDSVFSDVYVFDSENFKKHMSEVKEHLEEIRTEHVEKRLQEVDRVVNNINIKIRYDSTWKKLKDKREWTSKFEVTVDSNICRVDISNLEIPELHIPDFDSINSLMEEAARNIQFYTYQIPKFESHQQGFTIEYYDGDSVKSFGFEFEGYNVDSEIDLQNRMYDSVYKYDYEVFKGFNDSMFKRFQFYFDDSFRYFDREGLREKMKKLQEEMYHFREEMHEMQDEIRREKTTDYK